MNEKARIIIEITKEDDHKWSSTHKFEGIDETQYAMILMDIVRDLFIDLLKHYHGHEHYEGEG